MKIRSISLTNVRRFTDPVSVTGLTDGLNVLSEANEYGKSTLFDALQAVFFKPYGANDKEIKALRPHAGGAPEVSVEVETGGGVFTVSKRWTSKALAKVEQNGQLIAQADEAEAWVSGLIGASDGGPSGLLWVRQGLTALSEGNKKEKDAALEARRDLLSSVTGEVEAMTGGRRMDMALSRCKEELSVFATSGGRSKKGGPWKTAEEKVEALQAEHDDLSRKVVELREHLDVRRRKRRELSELEAPEAAAARRQRLDDATDEYQAALQHTETLEAEERKVEAAQLTVKSLSSRLDNLRHAIREQNEASEALTAASAQCETAKAQLKDAEAVRSKADKAFEQTQTKCREAQETHRASQRLQAAIDGATRRKELHTRIKDAETARKQIEESAADARQYPDAKPMRRLEELAVELATAKAVLNNASAKVFMNYEDDANGKVWQDGAALTEGEPVSIPNGAELVIETIGTLVIDTSVDGEEREAVERAERALAEQLEQLDCTTIKDARTRAARRQALELERIEANAKFESLAPEGVEALRIQLSAIPEVDEGGADAPSLNDAEQLLADAEAKFLEASAERTSATDHLSDVRAVASKFEASLEAAKARDGRAKAAIAALDETDEASLTDALKKAVTALEAVEAVFKEMGKTAPNVSAAEAKLARAKSIEHAAKAEIGMLKPALAMLDANISRSAGEAVEERLEETRQQLEIAQSSLQAITREVAVLQKLQAVLEGARSEAHERYFEPVTTELKPLLQLLWPDAELSWGDRDLLPTALIRNGQEEAIDILSGGTKEQISLLVRLAFARMLARNGESAPIILDDALVFTDDDRIERMFDALHQQAGDLQIIVLSCRQRAFRDLGGTTLDIRKIKGGGIQTV